MNAEFLLLVATTLCLVKAGAFWAIGRFDPQNTAAKYLAAALACAGLSFAGELVLTTGFWPGPVRMLIAVAMAAALVLVAYGVAARYRIALPRGGGLAIVGASALLYLMILDLPREDMTRQTLYQTPYALICLMCLAILLRVKSRTLFEIAMTAAFGLLALYFLSKPFIATLVGGVGVTPDQYASSLYGALSVASGAVLLLILATIALVAAALDSAQNLIGHLERDGTTGFLTRNGFMNHAERQTLSLVHREETEHDASPTPLTLSLFALDKSAAGTSSDATIAGVDALMPHLKAIVPHSGLIGRMGEYDFAALVPGQNLIAARDAAEVLRAAMAAQPQDRKITVSIGITEREPGDVYADMIGRALWALDEAQKAGGNCVRLSARSGIGLTSYFEDD